MDEQAQRRRPGRDGPVTPFAFEQRAAPPPIADLAESVWTARGTIRYGRERILPTPRPVLVINLGSPFHVRASAEGGVDAVRRAGWLVGPQTRYVENQPLAETDVVGVTLKPWGPAALFDLSADELADRVVDLEAVWGPGFEQLRERLAGLDVPAERRALVARALAARRRHGPPRAVDFAADGLASGRLYRVAMVTDELRISRKHLNHLFDRYVGLPPRAYARVHRFNRALRALGVLDPPPLADVAHAHGYYDQAHMNRDFAAFADITPTAYLRLRSAHLTPDTDDSGLFVPGI